MTELKKKARRGAGRVAFLAHLEGIKGMIDAGHPLVSVFEEYESRLSIKSGQFGKYVRKFIRSKPEDGNRPVSATADKKPIKKSEVGLPKFTRTESRDDLIHPKSK